MSSSANTLDFAHRHDIVHRDVKPENILLHEGQALVADFGIAHAVNPTDGEQLTAAGLAIGTPNYMSPEQAVGSGDIDARTDVYALACVLFECLTGHPPYRGSALSVIGAHQSAPIPSVTAVRDDVPRATSEAIRMALAKRPADRFRSVSDFAAALGVPIHESTTPSGSGVNAGGTIVSPHMEAVSISDQQIQYCHAADGTSIAYATVGKGPVLVKAANWLSHLEFDWQTPVWRHWWKGLARYNRLVRYDERGCGLSDWDVADMSFEAWVNDLEAVVDAAGLDRFSLLGVSQGGPIAIAYAVRHPERVTRLILHGSYARGAALRGSSEQFKAESKMMVDLIQVGWGSGNPTFRQVFSTMFYPDATKEELDGFNELQRVSTSPENAGRIYHGFLQLDVRELAGKVSVPTLVLHCEDERRVPLAEGRLLASLIPGAELVTLPSRNHIPLAGEPSWGQFLDAVYDFLGVGPGTNQ